jgi:hypothetical protein
MNEINILKQSLQDYFTKELLTLLIFPLLGSTLVLYLAFFSAASAGIDALENAQIQIEQQQTKIKNGEITEEQSTQTYTGSSIIDFLLKYTVTSWIVGFLVYTLGILTIGYLSIFVSLIIIGFLTPRILSIIGKRHYPLIKFESNFNLTDGIVKITKTTFTMILLFFVMIPFYFFPLINIVAINVPFYYFFHKMLHFDIISSITTKEEFGEIYYKNKNHMRIRTLFLYFISLLPFVAFFISIFYIIYLGHVYFQELQKIKS